MASEQHLQIGHDGAAADAHGHTQSPEQMQTPPSHEQQHPASATPAHVRQQPVRRPSSPNASSAPITQAKGSYTHGTINQHPAHTGGSFRVGVSEDRNKKCRRTMEDSHAFIYDFGGVKGQGYFSVFDGHAGKHAAEWCGAHFHKYLLKQLNEGEATQPIPDLLNATFHVVDGELSKLAAQGGTHSGCTAVTAFPARGRARKRRRARARPFSLFRRRRWKRGRRRRGGRGWQRRYP